LGAKIVLYNTYDSATLERRDDLAQALRGAPAEAAFSASLLTSRVPAHDVPFPHGLAPVPHPISPAPSPLAPLPKVDVVAMMDTVAEAQAMADVLTPKHTWYDYAERFEEHYVPMIGPKGPSLMSRRLGRYFVSSVGGLKVLWYKTDLHLHTDSKRMPDGSYSLPLKDMLAQIITEARPRLFLTTGTSGGVFCAMHLGDVVVTRAARFVCQRKYGEAPFNNTTYSSDWTVPTNYKDKAVELMQRYADNLSQGSGQASDQCSCGNLEHPTLVFYDGDEGIAPFHPILTTDFFEFGTSTNNLDKLGMAVEMDDAVLGLVCSEMTDPPLWASVRNLSDPTINGELDARAQEVCAASYYAKFGYWTTVMSALTTWSLIAGLAETH
jgi:hypothetical protein